MSQTADTATATAPTLDPARSGETALEWFERLVWHDHHVCSECFAPLKLGDPEPGESALEPRTGRACLGEDLIEPPASVVNCAPKAQVRTTCLECGSVRGLSQGETLSTSEAIDRVPALVARLQEAGYVVDSDRVYDVVRHLKESDYSSRDRHIFAAAAAMGVSV